MDAFFDESLIPCAHPSVMLDDDRTVICTACGRNIADDPLPHPVGVARPLSAPEDTTDGH